MDGDRFDHLARGFAATPTRRTIVGGALGLIGIALHGGSAEAARKKRANGAICRKNGDCASGTCGPKDATGRSRCSGGFCNEPDTCGVKPTPCGNDSCCLCAESLDGAKGCFYFCTELQGCFVPSDCSEGFSCVYNGCDSNVCVQPCLP